MAWIERRATRYRVRFRLPDGAVGTDSWHPTKAAAQLRCKQVDIDTALDTYLDLARKLTTGAGDNKVFGAVWTTQTSLDIHLAFIWPFGGELWDKDQKKAVLDGKEALEAIQFMGDLTASGRSLPPRPTRRGARRSPPVAPEWRSSPTTRCSRTSYPPRSPRGTCPCRRGARDGSCGG